MLKMFFTLTLLLSVGFLPAGGGAAEIDTNTPAGIARIIDGTGGEKALMLGSRMIALPGAYYASFAGRVGDLLLLSLSPGGNACAGHFMWVHAIPGDIRQSAQFGTCAGLLDISYDSESVRVRMPSMRSGQGDITFVYDGKNPIREIQHPLEMPSVERGPEFWIGKHPAELISAAEWQGPLLDLLGQDALDEAQVLIRVANSMYRDGNWVVGRGCMAHNCNRAFGAIAHHLHDGRLMVALWQAGQAPRLWGDPGGHIPAEILGVLSQQ